MRSLIAALLLASVSMPAMAQARQDTLAEAIASAISNNPTLAAQRATRGVANETLEQAKAQMRPQVGLNGSYGAQNLTYGRVFNTPAGSFPLDGGQERATLGLEARQSIYSGGSLTAQRDQAQHEVDAAEADFRSAEQDLVLSVVAAYVDVRRAEEVVQIRETNVNSLGQQVQAARDRFDAGEVTRTDVAQAEARKSGAEANLAAARSELSTARAAYERVVGRIPVQLAPPPVAPEIPPTLEQSVDLARSNNLQLVSARAQENAAAQGIDVAKGALRPRVGIVGSAGMQETYQDQSFRDTNVGLTAELSIPLYRGGLLNSRTRQARLEADRARYNRMSVERDVTAQVTSAWHTVIAAREAFTASEAQVSAAEVALEGAEQELAVGTRITLDVLDQERELLEAQLGRVDAQRAYYLAIHRLLAAVGRLRVDIIGR
ncbi:MAG TPA: TolC family outer membrane protein [Hyphomonadaceae bacterium]|nr:TolC family outer membrane protein [Hyphomonadaceae bacterium]